ncbi:uncharacterized protein LOC108207232 [Daucus carota subsp. sativus]|uniref:uncharacterized protein LOC108207232 n=1 Tax=Daucus carota subsp. sativus TaxID=79200 RepID=UPI003082F599
MVLGWELRACILLSLFLQIFLAVAGTFRRLASQRRIVKIIWLAYLLAEFVPVFGLGLIVSKQSLLYYSDADSAPIGSSNSVDDHFEVHCFRSNKVVACGDENILMYCAAFLLVHLGGPDSITAFAMEDNELWLRNLFYLASKCIAVAYAIYQSVLTIHKVQVPVLLLFLYGIIKCTERTCALYYGSAKSFRNSMLSKSNSGFNIIPIIDKSLIEMNVKDFEHVEVLQNAFLLFTVFKGLVVDLSVSILERNQSRDLFLAKSSADAFRLVEVELNYLYDVLFTKIPLLHSKLGLCCRSLSFIAVVSSLVLFNSSSEGYHHTKEMFPYILFSGAIFLEVIAFYMLLFSDWTVVKLEPLSEAFPHRNLWKDKFLKCILFVNRTRNDFYHFFLRHVGVNHHIGSEFSDGRWANSFSTFNLTCYCLHRCSKGREKIYTSLRLLRLLNGFVYVQSQPLSQFIASFIFDELKMKSEIAETVVVAKQNMFV